MTAEQLRERLRARLQDARGSLLNAHALVRSLREDHVHGANAHVEGQVTSALGAVEAAQRATRVLPPRERLEVALDTLADAVDPSRLGVNAQHAPDLRETALMVLEARHDMQTASGSTGDGSIPD